MRINHSASQRSQCIRRVQCRGANLPACSFDTSPLMSRPWCQGGQCSRVRLPRSDLSFSETEKDSGYHYCLLLPQSRWRSTICSYRLGFLSCFLPCDLTGCCHVAVFLTDICVHSQGIDARSLETTNQGSSNLQENEEDMVPGWKEWWAAC